jgi:hypothetical protein
LCGDGRLARALDENLLTNETLTKVVAPLSDLLQKDVSLYADLAYEVLLAIENNPPAENIIKIQTQAGEIISNNEAPPAIMHTLKLIQRVAASLRVQVTV